MLSFYTKEEVAHLIRLIRERISTFQENISDERSLEIIEDTVFSQEKSCGCSHHINEDLVDYLFLSLRREMSILQPYVEDPSVTEIMVNGRDNIFVEKKGIITKLPLSFDSTEELEELIRRIASKVHREINELNPIVDARLKDGSRVHGVYGNIAISGPTLTIRKFPEKIMTMKDYIYNDTLTSQCAQLLKVLVGSGYNCFVCGGTSSGKTTLLNVLAQLVPINERVIVIEDSAELQIDRIENIVRLECRNGNIHSRGEISMADLVKASLRMRPDRIIIGEIRGPEVFHMINAMNTGHSGCLCTGHANSIEGMLRRLEALYLQAADFPVEAIRSQICEGLDIMIHMQRLRDGSRKVTEIAELDCLSGEHIVTNTLYRWEEGLTGNRLIHREKLSFGGYDDFELQGI